MTYKLYDIIGSFIYEPYNMANFDHESMGTDERMGVGQTISLFLSFNICFLVHSQDLDGFRSGIAVRCPGMPCYSDIRPVIPIRRFEDAE